jgi:DNA-binding NarL/FixJ family response regulator
MSIIKTNEKDQMFTLSVLAAERVHTGRNETSSMQNPSSILIVGNWQQRRQSLYALLHNLPEIGVIQLTDYNHAWMCIVDQQPTLVIFDHWFPGDNMNEFSVALKKRFPCIRSIVLGYYPHSSQEPDLLPADLCLEGDVPSDKIIEGVRRILNTGTQGTGEKIEGEPQDP